MLNGSAIEYKVVVVKVVGIHIDSEYGWRNMNYNHLSPYSDSCGNEMMIWLSRNYMRGRPCQ